MLLASLLLSFCVLATMLHCGSTLLAVAHIARKRRRAGQYAGPTTSVSIIRTVCGLDDVERRTLASSFHLHGPRHELIFCAANRHDPALPYLEQLIARHPDVDARICIGSGAESANPKLDNMRTGWAAARGDWIIFSDSNLELPSDYIGRLFEEWSEGTGLVCAPPIGADPTTFWAEIECAFLNTYQARWQIAADAVGYGFAQGKTMLWRRDDLERWGGPAALSRELAEDAAATKIVREGGKRVRLVATPFAQPLGNRTFSEVWKRQTRWAALRRLSFPSYFAAEVFTGMHLPMAACAAFCLLTGTSMLGPLSCLVGLWLGSEVLMAAVAGWHLNSRSVAAWLLRDALIPLVWLKAWLDPRYEWRGTRVGPRSRYSDQNVARAIQPRG